MRKKINFSYLVVEERGKKMTKHIKLTKGRKLKERGKDVKGQFENEKENKFLLVFPPKFKTKQRKRKIMIVPSFLFRSLSSKHFDSLIDHRMMNLYYLLLYSHSLFTMLSFITCTSLFPFCRSGVSRSM